MQSGQKGTDGVCVCGGGEFKRKQSLALPKLRAGRDTKLGMTWIRAILMAGGIQLTILIGIAGAK